MLARPGPFSDAECATTQKLKKLGELITLAAEHKIEAAELDLEMVVS
jgi:hypothetical protein